MGDQYRMSCTRRAILILTELGELPSFRDLVGKTVKVVSADVSNEIYGIGEEIVLEVDGETRTYSLGITHEVTESGVAGYDLECWIDEDCLRDAIRAVLADPDANLDARDREALIEDMKMYLEEV